MKHDSRNLKTRMECHVAVTALRRAMTDLLHQRVHHHRTMIQKWTPLFPWCRAKELWRYPSYEYRLLKRYLWSVHHAEKIPQPYFQKSIFSFPRRPSAESPKAQPTSTAQQHPIMAEFDSVIVKEWRKIEEDIEKMYIRPMNVENLKCVLTCFDRAGTAWTSRELDECKAPCFQKSQVKQMILDRVSWDWK